MNLSKKKLLFLDHTPFVGGAQLSLIQHIEAIDKEKFEVLLVCDKKAKEIGLTEKYENASINYLFTTFEKLKIINPLVIFRFLRSVIDVKKIIKSENVDLIISNTVRASIIGSLTAWMSRKKIIWFIRDFTFPLFFFKLFSYFPEKIIFNSKATALYYENYLKNKEKKIIVYIGRDFYKKAEEVKEEEILKQRKVWGADNDTVIIGYVGRLVEWKGPQVLIRAINSLKKEGIKNIKCVIVGAGEGQEQNNEEELRRVVKNLKLEKYIIFTGYKKDLAIIMKSLNILALTSIEPEPFSSTVVDAMMAKVPVIGTNIGGTPEIIFNIKTGLFVRPDNADDLSNAITKLINNDELKKEVVKNAYNRVIKYHTSNYTTKKIEDIYLKI